MQATNTDRVLVRDGVTAAERWPRLPSVATVLRLASAGMVGLLAANCSSAPNKVASGGSGRSLDPKYGVYASPRVVEDGEPVPKGGGREMIGKPYQVAGRTYVPQENRSYSRTGLASWYGAAFHGRLTANGEVFDRQAIAAAHTTMPLPSYARVTNLENDRSIIVRVNDRGPYHANRVMDVSEGVAEALAFRRAGTARVRVDYVGRASTRGSDDTKLLATLRTDGRQAPFPGQTASPVMVADAGPGAVPLLTPRPQALAYRQPEPEVEDLAESAAEATPVATPRAPAALPVVLASADATFVPAQRAAIAASAAPPAAPAAASRATGTVPLPPERPFDLGVVPSAATPVPPPPPRRTPFAQLSSGRTATAGLN